MNSLDNIPMALRKKLESVLLPGEEIVACRRKNDFYSIIVAQDEDTPARFFGYQKYPEGEILMPLSSILDLNVILATDWEVVYHK